MERILKYFIVLCYVSLLNALPPKIIDGNSSDWTNSEIFSGGDSSRWGISWDRNNLYFAIFSPQLSNQINTQIMNFFIDTDPEIQPTSGTGTLVGNTYNTQTPRPSFTANYFVEWRFDNATASLLSYVGKRHVDSSLYICVGSWTVSSTIRLAKNGNFIEFAVPLANIAAPDGIYVCGCVIDETPLAERALLSFPKTFANSYQANITWGAYFGFPLQISTIPPALMDIGGNNEVNRNAFPAQIIYSGSWGVASSWYRGKIANYQSNAYVTSNLIVNANYIECLNLFIEPGASVTVDGNLQLISNSSYILNYGNFASNGQVNTSNSLSTNGTVSSFKDIYLRGASRIANSTIRNSITMYSGSYLDDNGPIYYAVNSELVYADSDFRTRSREWISNSGAGAPYNVRIAANTLLLFQNSEYPLNVGILPGTLTIDSGSAFNGEGAVNLTVNNLVNGGTLSLGPTGIFNLYVMGSFNNTGSIVCSSPSRTVWVNGVRFNKPNITQTPGQGYVRLSVPNTYTSYRWNNLEITSEIDVTQNGSYYVNVTDTSGCFATSDYVVVIITTTPITSGSSGTTSEDSNLQSELSTTQSDANKSNLPIFIGSATGGFILIILLILAAVYFARRNQKKKKQSTELISLATDNGVLQGIIVEEVIGEGSYGKVYRGNWNETSVALKQLKNKDDKELQNEIKTLRVLNHPNIIRILGIFSDKANSYIVMEFMETSLLSLLHSKRFSLESMISMMIGICQGMAYLESQKIAHCDLAARNILVDKEGKNCKVSDFGLSKQVATERNSTYVIGVPVPVRWAAPEILKQHFPDIKSDVWSFGVVMWEILTHGEVPYKQYSVLSSLSIDIIDKKVFLDKPIGCTDYLYGILKECCSYLPENRPSFIEVLRKLKSMSTNPVISASSIQNMELYNIIPDTPKKDVISPYTVSYNTTPKKDHANK